MLPLPPFTLAVVVDLPASPGVVVLGALVLALPVVISTLNGLISIIRSFRKTPPDHEHYATKDELAALEERIADAATERNRVLMSNMARGEQRLTEIRGEIGHQLDQGQTLFNSMSREIHSLAVAIAELRGESKTRTASKH